MSSLKKHFAGLSPDTFLLAAVSFLADVSSEMLYPVLPIFLTQVLGANADAIGLIEGLAQAIQNAAHGLSGWLSDKIGRYKRVALFGYVLSASAKPLIGLSTSWFGAFGARALDRFGAGTRSAPRDALVAASTDDAHRGKAFGLEGFGDNLGAFLGPIVALTLLGVFHVGLRAIFLLAFVPGSLSVLAAALVRQKPVPVASKPEMALHVVELPKKYWKYLIATALFGIGNSSNAFLVLRTKALGASLSVTIVIYASFNLVAALASYPAGYVSDKLGRRRVLSIGLLVFLVVYAGFGLTTNVVLIGFLFALYGVYQGTYRSVGKALATDLAPPELRASGVGWYTATIGFTGLVASVLGGQLWTHIGPEATFLFGASTALVGSAALVALVPA